MREWRLRKAKVPKLVNDGTEMPSQIAEPLLLPAWGVTPRDHTSNHRANKPEQQEGKANGKMTRHVFI